MITYTEAPSVNQVILNTIPAPPGLDVNGGRILYVFTALVDGVYALDMTIYIQVGGFLQECTTLLTLNSVLQGANPNYNARTTQTVTEEMTHSHKAKVTLIAGDVVYFAGSTSGPAFDALYINGAMIVLKVG
jgi:hypothetical protein